MESVKDTNNQDSFLISHWSSSQQLMETSSPGQKIVCSLVYLERESRLILWGKRPGTPQDVLASSDTVHG